MRYSQMFTQLYSFVAILFSLILPVFQILIIYDLYHDNLYHQNRLILLITSIIDLCVVHIGYIVLTEVLLWSTETISNKYLQKTKFLINFFILLIISPFIPAIIHMTMQNEQSFLSKFIDKYFKGYFKVKSIAKDDIIDSSHHEWSRWTMIIITFHAPFIGQFIVQTLPQIIIQSLLLSNNYNIYNIYITHLSIALSLGIISFMMNIIPFCGFSMNSFSVIFTLFDYCCLTTDFLLLFISIICMNALPLIGDIIHFKFIYVIPILYVWSIIGLLHDLYKNWYNDMNGSKRKKICILIASIIPMSILLLWWYSFFVIVIELACFSWIMLIFFGIFRARLIFQNQPKHGANLWYEFYKFVNNSTSNKDKIVRLCTINHILIENNDTIKTEITNLINYIWEDHGGDNDYGTFIDDDNYLSYFKTEKHCNLYDNVKLDTFHDSNIFGKHSNIWYYILNDIYLNPLNELKEDVSVSWNDYKPAILPLIQKPFIYLKWNAIYCRAVIYWALFSYILGPYYILSRLLNIFSLFYIVLIWIFGINNSFLLLCDYMFIKIILSVLCVLFCCVIIFGQYYIKRCYDIEWNILPGFNIGHDFDLKDFDQEYNQQIMDKIRMDYTELIQIPIREQQIIDTFGPNIGGIVIQYVGRFRFDSNDENV